MRLTALGSKINVSKILNIENYVSQAGVTMLDEMDIKILRILQQDCTRPVADIGKEVGLSTTPCWRRVQKLEEAGVIRRRVAILDANQVNAGVTVFVSIKTDQHSHEWLEKFHSAVADFAEVVEFYRMSGDVDYLLRVAVPDIAAYDAFYKKLIARIEIAKVSSAFAMEQIKYTTALPLQFATATVGNKGERANI
jgi:Lrp/AsnC family transcriptional regulator